MVVYEMPDGSIGYKAASAGIVTVEKPSQCSSRHE
jgi:hypothetical protein